MRIDRPDPVWCADAIFVPVGNGVLYPVVIIGLGHARDQALNGIVKYTPATPRLIGRCRTTHIGQA
ncbi:hypothetical protein R3X27_18295 [Tropicimonas sp. TH_r6]|nr:hypothetical protein [Tropicimonas sp. TH_r6]